MENVQLTNNSAIISMEQFKEYEHLKGIVNDMMHHGFAIDVALKKRIYIGLEANDTVYYRTIHYVSYPNDEIKRLTEETYRENENLKEKIESLTKENIDLNKYFVPKTFNATGKRVTKYENENYPIQLKLEKKVKNYKSLIGFLLGLLIGTILVVFMVTLY